MNKRKDAFYAHGKCKRNGRRFTVSVVMRKDRTFVGISECSNLDQFCKKTGRQLSESRARKNPISSIEGMDREKAIEYLYLCKNTFEEFGHI